jgi:ABC-type branched-subunit amino acid transport system substrate-binding protein
MRARHGRVVVVGILIAVTALAGCKGNSGSTTPSAKGGSAPGLTATTITVGTVADLTGPVPGLFQGAVDGVKAYFAYVNSTGGVDGRTLVDDAKDSALSCSSSSQDVTSLVPKVFAFVGSFELYDSCTTPTISKNSTTPYIGVALDTKLTALPNSFSPEPTPPGFRTGADKYIMQKYGVSRLGFISGQGAQEPIESYEYEAAHSVGATVAYKRFATSTETDFTSDVIRMRKAKVDWVNLSALAITQGAHIIQDMAAQNFHPKVIEVDTAYTAQFFKLFSNPSITNNIVIGQSYARFLGEDAATIPAVGTFDTWMKKTNPSFSPDLYSVYGWTGAQMFVQALKQAGANPTQAAVLAALKNVHSFDGGGLIAPDDPGAKKPSTCYIMMQIENQKYVKIYPSSTGFSCKPGGYYTPSS